MAYLSYTNRYPNSEHTSFSRTAVKGQVSPVVLNYLLHNCQPDTASPDPRLLSFPATIEAFKYLLLVFYGNPYSVILHRKLCFIILKKQIYINFSGCS